MRDKITYRGERRLAAKIIRRQAKQIDREYAQETVGDVCRDLTSKQKYFQNRA